MSESASSPPSYFSPLVELEVDEAQYFNSASDLPTYTRQPGLSASPRILQTREFSYNLKKKGKPWAVLTIFGNSALSDTTPVVLEGSSLNGTVNLLLGSGDPIQAVVVSVKGQIITGASPGDQYTFLDIATNLWSQSLGDPRNPSSVPSDIKFTDKLRGDYCWPFSIPLPREVVLCVGAQNESQTFHLPQTFVERHTRASIQYEVILHLSRSKLRTDHRIQVTFGYIPVTRPGPASPLRQLAYQENTPLWGPDEDPEGWHTLPSADIRGRIFGRRPVDGKCTLSLAKPLCYTRGSVIPCSIVIETSDEQALHLLSSPKAIVLRLRRSVKCHPDHEHFTESAIPWKDEIDLSQLAAWWPSPANNSRAIPNSRRLNGELHLLPDTKPTSAMAHFSIEYTIVLFPFDVVTFEPASSQPLCMLGVEIATSYGPGPRPRTYAPPGYEEYSTSVTSQSFHVPDTFLA
ncbi:hypothetical protein Hypma_006734 [Hypsizygus marmoreus]|uniref:Arrestin-like N-terminal domain-containing protein n=1 Tax=Hypsizygus marmoreus TaxID=39966 RepID=A0A369JZW8_HYPMA|nr:hypothetical protein Hypma_006734 [Hypsizygus marmoreus]